MIRFILKRWEYARRFTGGVLSVVVTDDEGTVKVCDTIEPPADGPVRCIPEGTYEVSITVKSPTYSQKASYAWCGGYLPRLKNVPGRSGILIHSGNTADHTRGCILVGKRQNAGFVANSMNTLKELYKYFRDAEGTGDKVFITVC